MPAAICGGLMMFSLCAAPLQAKVVLPSLFRYGDAARHTGAGMGNSRQG